MSGHFSKTQNINNIMPKTLIKIDTKVHPEELDVVHNRWHPDIPMVAMVKPGDEFRVECIDWTGGQNK